MKNIDTLDDIISITDDVLLNKKSFFMKPSYLLLIAILSVFSLPGCNKKTIEQNETYSCGCGTKDPLNDLAWTKKVLSSSYYFPNGSQLYVDGLAKFYCCTYNNENVFFLDNPASNLWLSIQVVFDCQGNIIMSGFKTAPLQDFEKNKKNEQLLWSK